MTTSVFPGAQDTDANLYRVVSTDPVIAPHHNNHSDAIEAIESALLAGSSDLAAKASGTGHQGGLVPDPGATAGSTHYLREDMTWVVPSGGGGGSISYESSNLGADVTIGTANTYTDGPTVSLAAGTWLVHGHCTLENLGGGNEVTVVLWDGTTAMASGETSLGGSAIAINSVSLIGVVVLSTTTTIKMSFAATGTGSVMKAASPYNPKGNVASGIVAIQLA